MNIQELARLLVSGGRKALPTLAGPFAYDGKSSTPFPSSPLYANNRDVNNPNFITNIAGLVTPLAPVSRFETLPASQLVSHEGAPDVARVLEYMQKIKAGEKIKPLKVMIEGTKFGIEDGKHRFQAYQNLGINKIPTEIIRRFR